MAKALKLAVVFALLVLGVAAYAQAGDAARASIPFDFMVQGKSLPAGTYILVEGVNPRIVVLRNLENPTISALVLLRPGQTLTDGKAEFVVQRNAVNTGFHDAQK